MNNMKILFISLGCDKNLVDSEHMLGLLVEHGFEITDSEEDAEVIVINTCCSVSYTHLDVYKRQPCVRTRCSSVPST